ncbi:Pr6Pr family membrane protein [Phytohabitans kaempferiae]|uniref:Pr6Pr family membrane protein n=1 Tax=Phytohabitans kaempferiae TaxID=1620943 RepID=A0ABV6LYU3_9ACTN
MLSARAARIWHFVLFAVVAAAFVIQLVLVLRGDTDINAAAGGEPTGTGTRVVNMFSYFTIQSNLLVLAAAATLAAVPARDGRWWRVLRLDGLLGITITGIVYATVLAGNRSLEGIEVWLNAAFHFFCPCWTLLGWLLFGPRPRITWWVVGAAFAWPAAWVAYTLVRGAVTGWYPYPFLDVGDLGYPVALRNVGFVLVLALAIAAILRYLDGRLPRAGAPPAPASRPAAADPGVRPGGA